MTAYDFCEHRYSEKDMCTGTVLGKCNSGVFIGLDNGNEAFAYNFFCVPDGAKVLCSVKRCAAEGRRVLVTIESVDCYECA